MRTVEGVNVLPLVVIDTKSAVLDLEDENSNSEASKAMAALKQGFEGLPVWIIGHVAKTTIGRTDLAALSMRGASAYEADANQVLYLISEKDKRYLVRGKTRFEAKWPELQITSHCADTMAVDEFGEIESVTMRWNVSGPALQSRKEAVALAKEHEKNGDIADLRDEVREVVQTAWNLGNPINREGVKAKVRRNKTSVSTTIENLLSELWLYEVTVPAKQRTNSKRSTFLVDFTTEEHEAFVASGVPPSEKLKIPQSWRKPEIPSDSEPSCTDVESAAGKETPDVPKP
jgi:nucleoside-triphosphatase THEP1